MEQPTTVIGAASSQHKGVIKVRNRWEARAFLNGYKKYLGRFKTQAEAIKAYNDAIENHVKNPYKYVYKDGLFKCTTCNTKRMRIYDGFIGGQAAFKDEHGKRWSRRKCPTCYSRYQVEHRRQSKKGEPDLLKVNRLTSPEVTHRTSVYIAPGTKLRPCGTCKEPTTNYYHCVPCRNRMRDRDCPSLGEAEFMERYEFNGR